MFDFNRARSTTLDRLQAAVDEINDLEHLRPELVLPELLPILSLHLYHLRLLRGVLGNHANELEEAHDAEMEARYELDTRDRELLGAAYQSAPFRK
jgi:hypothetical protein